MAEQKTLHLSIYM